MCLCMKCIFQIISRHPMRIWVMYSVHTMYVMQSPLSAPSKHTNAVKCTLMYAHTHTLAHMHMHCDQYNTRINAALIHVIFFFVVREKFCTLFLVEKNRWLSVLNVCEFIINKNKYNIDTHVIVHVWTINTYNQIRTYIYAHAHAHCMYAHADKCTYINS